jgi:hypothetical protein
MLVENLPTQFSEISKPEKPLKKIFWRGVLAFVAAFSLNSCAVISPDRSSFYSDQFKEWPTKKQEDALRKYFKEQEIRINRPNACEEGGSSIGCTSTHGLELSTVVEVVKLAKECSQLNGGKCDVCISGASEPHSKKKESPSKKNLKREDEKSKIIKPTHENGRKIDYYPSPSLNKYLVGISDVRKIKNLPFGQTKGILTRISDRRPNEPTFKDKDGNIYVLEYSNKKRRHWDVAYFSTDISKDLLSFLQKISCELADKD